MWIRDWRCEYVVFEQSDGEISDPYDSLALQWGPFDGGYVDLGWAIELFNGGGATEKLEGGVDVVERSTICPQKDCLQRIVFQQ